MRLLTDQDVYELTIRQLRTSGHDVITARDLGLSRAPDDELLRVARSNGRILVTRDRDYGNLVFQHAHGFGVLPVRLVSAPSVRPRAYSALLPHRRCPAAAPGW